MNQKDDEIRALGGGSERKSRASEATVTAGTPRPPKWLSKGARDEYRRMARHLQERNTLSAADGPVLVLYACAFSRFIAAQRDLDLNGLRVTVTVLDSHGKAVEVTRDNPALRLVQQAEKTVLALTRQFGTTPATRERVKPAAAKDEQGDGITVADVDALLDRARTGKDAEEV